VSRSPGTPSRSRDDGWATGGGRPRAGGRPRECDALRGCRSGRFEWQVTEGGAAGRQVDTRRPINFLIASSTPPGVPATSRPSTRTSMRRHRWPTSREQLPERSRRVVTPASHAPIVTDLGVNPRRLRKQRTLMVRRHGRPPTDPPSPNTAAIIDSTTTRLASRPARRPRRSRPRRRPRRSQPLLAPTTPANALGRRDGQHGPNRDNPWSSTRSVVSRPVSESDRTQWISRHRGRRPGTAIGRVQDRSS
jgi:hypothetical protein